MELSPKISSRRHVQRTGLLARSKRSAEPLKDRTKHKKKDTMKSGKSLSELAAQIKSNQSAKKDFIADTSRLEYRPEGGNRGLIHFDANGNSFDVEPTNHCMRQIGDRVGIPSRYMERLATVTEKEDHRILLAHNVNYWFKKQPETRMLRTLMNGDHTARAFLSSRYRPLDNHDLAEIALPRIADAGCTVLSSEITERRLYIQAATPRMELDLNKARQSSGGDLRKVDPVQAGIVISNSEVGSGSIRVEPMLYRLSCFNGLITGSSIKRHHVGRANEVFAELEEAAEYFTDSTRQLDDRAFWAKVADVINGVFDTNRFKSLVEKFAATKDVKIVGAVEVVEKVAKQFRLTDGEQKSVLDHLVEGGDLSLFGLVNATTRTAEDAADYDRAIELERMGGDIIELPPTMWSKVA